MDYTGRASASQGRTRVCLVYARALPLWCARVFSVLCLKRMCVEPFRLLSLRLNEKVEKKRQATGKHAVLREASTA